MSITGISSVAGYARSGAEIQWEQEMHDYQALTMAIQSGNLVSIMKAFSAWQQDVQATPSSTNTPTKQQGQPFGSNTQANTDFQTLSKAVQSGDVSSAQSAFARLQQELKAAGTTLRSRSINGNPALPNNTTSTNPISTLTSTSAANSASHSTSASASNSNSASNSTSTAGASSEAAALDKLS